MAKIVQLPRLSDTMEEGVIAKWHVKEGDKVKRGQLIADVETDKATMEFESFDNGIVLKLVASEGEPMPIGTPIAVLGEKGEDPEAALAGAGKGDGEAKRSAEREGNGEAEREGKDDGEAKPRKAERAKAEKKPKTKREEPEEAEPEEEEPEEAEAEEEEPEEEEEEDGEADEDEKGPQRRRAEPPRDVAANEPVGLRRTDERIAASPLARRLARERGVDLADLRGSGPHGRIVKADVEAAAKAPRARTAAVGKRTFASQPDAPQKLSQMRKTIARRMAQSNAEIPHFYLRATVDMDRAVALRTELNEGLDGALPDAKVSFNDLVILAAAKALRVHPEINAYYDGKTIVRRGDVHVGMAVAVDEGLIVPPIRFTDQKSLRDIAAEAKDLGTRGRAKKLAPDEMSGSTFTVTNLGMFGIDEFSAVINPGEGAILAVGAINDDVVARDGTFAVAKRMIITLACDHRVMDGAMAARFLGTVRDFLQKPLTMLA